MSLTLSDDDVCLLWGALLLGKTLGERIIISIPILGLWPNDLIDDVCPLCGGEVEEDD